MNRRLAFCTVFLLATACANQWRTSDPQVNPADMMQWLQAAQGANSQSQTTASSEVPATDPGTTIFFADAPGPMGTVASVLAFNDLSFLDFAAPALSQVTQARVFFLDNPSGGTNGRQNELIVGITTSGQTDFQYYKFYGSGSIDSGEFAWSMVDGVGDTITLRSTDVDGSDFNGTIQLRAYGTDSDGNEVLIGKFSVLAGFK